MRFAFAVIAGLVSASAVQAQNAPKPAHAEGEQVFQTVCSVCHSVQPPAKAAPPMAHAAAYYLRRHTNADSAAAAIVAYIRQPAAERSAMPPHVITRFGLMPPHGHLPEAQLKAAARYVLTLADTMHVRGGMMHRQQHR